MAGTFSRSAPTIDPPVCSKETWPQHMPLNKRDGALYHPIRLSQSPFLPAPLHLQAQDRKPAAPFQSCLATRQSDPYLTPHLRNALGHAAFFVGEGGCSQCSPGPVHPLHALFCNSVLPPVLYRRYSMRPTICGECRARHTGSFRTVLAQVVSPHSLRTCQQQKVSMLLMFCLILQVLSCGWWAV
jgi:hypothetical protein